MHDHAQPTVVDIMIGVFDSGFGGLSVLAAFENALPDRDYLYLADSARAPYGARSLARIQQFTVESVEWLFRQGCPLVVLACNTASARALRYIQREVLPVRWPDRSVLGVVRPSVEALADLPPGAIPGVTPPGRATGTVALLATEGTVRSGSYDQELRKLAPGLRLLSHACPLWVPLVEAGHCDGPGTEWFVRRDLDAVLQSPTSPDRILLGCTHYPLLLPLLQRLAPGITFVEQGSIVAERLADWLRRHPWMDARIGRGATRIFATTDDAAWFARAGQILRSAPLEGVREVSLEGDRR